MSVPGKNSNNPNDNREEPKKPFEEIGAIFNGNEVKIRIPKCKLKVPKNIEAEMSKMCTCEGDGPCPNVCGYPGYDPTLENSSTTNDASAMCGVCNITPSDAPRGVEAEKILHPDKDVFILKIGKRTGEKNRTGSIEVELVTPRAPGVKKPATHVIKQIQCEADDIPCCDHTRPCLFPSRKKKPRRICCK